MESIWAVYHAVLDAKHGKKGKRYEDLCYKMTYAPDKCAVVGILSFWENNYTKYEAQVNGSDAQLLEDVSASTYPNGQTVNYNSGE